MENVRRISINILTDLENKNSNSTNLLNENTRNLSELDAKFLRELVYGTLENRIFIDYILKKLINTKLGKVNIKVLNTLRISIYQILFMDKIPEFAVINEAVNIVKSFKLNKLSGFVNGVLRNFLRDKEKLIEIDTKNKNDFLSIKYSVNRELVDIIVKDYGYEKAENIFQNSIGKPHFCIRYSSFEKSIEEFEILLEKEGFKLKKSKISKDAYYVANPTNILNTKLFKNGDFTVQDIGSILASEVLNPKENSKVLDICSAPGGKTAHIGFLMNNTGNILANDIVEKKLKKIQENLDRLKIKNVKTISFDACEFKEDLIEKFDYILCDVICSGSGIIDRKPEIKLFRSIEEIRNIIKIQRNIFENAIKYLKVGGSIVYSTCSILKSENEENIEYFLKENSNIKLEKIDFNEEKVDYINLFPIKNEHNGFFIAKFKKIME